MTMTAEKYKSLVSELADSAYAEMIRRANEDECLGWEAKVKSGKFTKAEMDKHALMNQAYGRHQAYARVRNELGDMLAALTRPSGGGTADE
jgi:hypothetical protein